MTFTLKTPKKNVLEVRQNR